jgi:hypothetical protein
MYIQLPHRPMAAHSGTTKRVTLLSNWTDRHDITEILLKVALSTIALNITLTLLPLISLYCTELLLFRRRYDN